MEIEAIHKRVIALDVHQAMVMACAIIEEPDGTVRIERKRFGAFKRDRRALAEWCAALRPEIAVMESTGIYWKSPYAALECVGIRALVVNAHFVKHVPGRKTDVSDAEWLASLARCGLLTRRSFVPPQKYRELRLVARQRQKMTGMLASQKNRLGKMLADAGVRLGVVVSDLHGKSARAMIRKLIEGATPEVALAQASRRLKAPREEIGASLEGDLSPAHIFVLESVIEHVERLEADIARFDAYLLAALSEPAEQLALSLLQTVPGIDRIGAAMLLVEIGIEMSEFTGSDAIARWSGLCPPNNISADKRTKGKKLKGNTWVRRLMCEFALAASKTCCAFQAKYKGLTVRRGHKRAIIACAHKMIRAIYMMLRKREPYRDSTVDLDALVVKRNAPRWIKALTRHGYLNTAT